MPSSKIYAYTNYVNNDVKSNNFQLKDRKKINKKKLNASSD